MRIIKEFGNKGKEKRKRPSMDEIKDYEKEIERVDDFTKCDFRVGMITLCKSDPGKHSFFTM